MVAILLVDTIRVAEPFARMVELVDTRDLKSLGFTAVRVQVPLFAPIFITKPR